MDRSISKARKKVTHKVNTLHRRLLSPDRSCRSWKYSSLSVTTSKNNHYKSTRSLKYIPVNHTAVAHTSDDSADEEFQEAQENLSVSKLAVKQPVKYIQYDTTLRNQVKNSAAQRNHTLSSVSQHSQKSASHRISSARSTPHAGSSRHFTGDASSGSKNTKPLVRTQPGQLKAEKTSSRNNQITSLSSLPPLSNMPGSWLRPSTSPNVRPTRSITTLPPISPIGGSTIKSGGAARACSDVSGHGRSVGDQASPERSTGRRRWIDSVSTPSPDQIQVKIDVNDNAPLVAEDYVPAVKQVCCIRGSCSDCPHDSSVRPRPTADEDGSNHQSAVLDKKFTSKLPRIKVRKGFPHEDFIKATRSKKDSIQYPRSLDETEHSDEQSDRPCTAERSKTQTLVKLYDSNGSDISKSNPGTTTSHLPVKISSASSTVSKSSNSSALPRRRTERSAKSSKNSTTGAAKSPKNSTTGAAVGCGRPSVTSAAVTSVNLSQSAAAGHQSAKTAGRRRLVEVRPNLSPYPRTYVQLGFLGPDLNLIEQRQDKVRRHQEYVKRRAVRSRASTAGKRTSLPSGSTASSAEPRRTPLPPGSTASSAEPRRTPLPPGSTASSTELQADSAGAALKGGKKGGLNQRQAADSPASASATDNIVLAEKKCDVTNETYDKTTLQSSPPAIVAFPPIDKHRSDTVNYNSSFKEKCFPLCNSETITSTIPFHGLESSPTDPDACQDLTLAHRIVSSPCWAPDESLENSSMQKEDRNSWLCRSTATWNRLIIVASSVKATQEAGAKKAQSANDVSSVLEASPVKTIPTEALSSENTIPELTMTSRTVKENVLYEDSASKFEEFTATDSHKTSSKTIVTNASLSVVDLEAGYMSDPAAGMFMKDGIIGDVALDVHLADNDIERFEETEIEEQLLENEVLPPILENEDNERTFASKDGIIAALCHMVRLRQNKTITPPIAPANKDQTAIISLEAISAKDTGNFVTKNSSKVHSSKSVTDCFPTESSTLLDTRDNPPTWLGGNSGDAGIPLTSDVSHQDVFYDLYEQQAVHVTNLPDSDPVSCTCSAHARKLVSRATQSPQRATFVHKNLLIVDMAALEAEPEETKQMEMANAEALVEALAEMNKEVEDDRSVDGDTRAEVGKVCESKTRASRSAQRRPTDGTRTRPRGVTFVVTNAREKLRPAAG